MLTLSWFYLLPFCLPSNSLPRPSPPLSQHSYLVPGTLKPCLLNLSIRGRFKFCMITFKNYSHKQENLIFVVATLTYLGYLGENSLQPKGPLGDLLNKRDVNPRATLRINKSFEIKGFLVFLFCFVSL